MSRRRARAEVEVSGEGGERLGSRGAADEDADGHRAGGRRSRCGAGGGGGGVAAPPAGCLSRRRDRGSRRPRAGPPGRGSRGLAPRARARALARGIARARPLRTAGELARVIGGVLGRGRPGLHPATRSFQAIRMAVNDELGELERFLADGYRVLRPRGRLAVLAYHSLEDRRGEGPLPPPGGGRPFPPPPPPLRGRGGGPGRPPSPRPPPPPPPAG